ncbi:MAG: ATPase, T2SS/T4P/T4SS family [bacterium]
MQRILNNKTIEKLKYDLVRDGLISYENLSKAEEITQNSNANLAQVLIQLNLISEEKLLNFIEIKLHIPYVNLDDYNLDENCLNLISKKDAQNYKIIPLFKIEDILTIAMADPLDLFALNSFINSINYNVEPVICSERSILQTIEKYYFQENIEFKDLDISINTEDTSPNWKKELNNEKTGDFQAQKIIEAIFRQAIFENTQEIFLENTANNGIAVKFKQGNEIFNKDNIPVLLGYLCLSKLKTMANLDLAIFELPQLGKIKLSIDSINIIASVSTFPTIKGERISIKIYKPPSKLDELSLNSSELSLIKQYLEKTGIIFVFGSGLSGKTSIIYSFLSSINEKNKNIMTLESIVKYDLPEINQCELNENVGFTFDKAIKFINSQSPDVIYIEEAFIKEGTDFIISLAQSKKLVLVEFLADNIQILLEKLKNPEFSEIKKYISCLVFVQNRNNIKFFTNGTINL